MITKPNHFINNFRKVLFILGLFPFLGQAQNYVDAVKLHYANTPVNQFDTLTNGTRVQEMGVDFIYGIPINEKLQFLTGFYLESISTEVRAELDSITDVYSTLLKLGFGWKLNSKWTVNLLALPKLSSDLENVDGDDFQIGFFGQAKYQKRDNLAYKFGLYYNGELFGPFFVPMLGLYYLSPNEKWEINVNLPLFADVNYAFNQRVRLGVNFFAFVRTFYLNSSYKGQENHYLQKQTNELYSYLQFHIRKDLILQTKVGYSIGRNYRVYEVGDEVKWGLSAFKFDDDRKQLNSDFKDGLVYRVRLLYRFHLN